VTKFILAQLLGCIYAGHCKMAQHVDYNKRMFFSSLGEKKGVPFKVALFGIKVAFSQLLPGDEPIRSCLSRPRRSSITLLDRCEHIGKI